MHVMHLSAIYQYYVM